MTNGCELSGAQDAANVHIVNFDMSKFISDSYIQQTDVPLPSFIVLIISNIITQLLKSVSKFS